MNTGQQLQVMKLCARRYQRMLERKQAKAAGDVNLDLNLAEPLIPQTNLI
jgi:2-succinyl-5-enolpyruvyl-6-hydroxy-3-cyclohexene-1-carboxylate synthase